MRAPRQAPWPNRVFSIPGKVANRGKKCSTYAHLPSYYISMLHDELKRGTRKIDVIRSLGCFLLLAIRGRISIVVELKERKMTPTEGCHVTERRFAFDHRL